MFKLPIPTRLTDYLGEAVVWTVISLSTAKLRSAERDTHFATSLHEVWGVTEMCCSGTPVSFAYSRKILCKKSIRQLPKKKLMHWTITPPPTLPCMVVRLAKYDYRRSRLTTEIV